jgi:hypothetical protein
LVKLIVQIPYLLTNHNQHTFYHVREPFEIRFSISQENVNETLLHKSHLSVCMRLTFNEIISISQAVCL